VARQESYVEVVGLPQPALDKLLPPGLSQVGPDAALGLIATPVSVLTAAYASPISADPVLALNRYTDHMLNMDAHWAVVGRQGDWIQVLTPVGRGALPSVSPNGVNHRTVWVHSADVTLNEAEYRIEISITDRLLTITGPEGSNSFHVGVGVEGVTDTPRGLCAVVGGIITQTGVPGLLTNCQSEKLVQFSHATDAATAIHVGTGFDPNTGAAVSNGCVRVTEEDFMNYLRFTPAGTPIVIS
jgi:lipoprotein-anchoring transpeptidase ErfK/SrfK